MAKVLAIGIATLDWIQVVDNYPDVDSEVRAQQQYLWRGGNATNTLAVLHQLGHACSWLGTLADDAFADLICADLDRNKIDYSLCPRVENSVSPTSHILLSQKTASRNIIHYRSLRELLISDSEEIDFSSWQWIHFEGRNVNVTKKLMQRIKQQHPDVVLSVEIEKPRNDIEQLLEYADHCLFSQHYANSQGYDEAEAFLHDIQKKLNATQDIVCAWGEKGAFALSAKGVLLKSPALDINVLDTRAAGDVFNAAYINARLNGETLLSALEKSCYLAGVKCGQSGIDGLKF